LGWGRGGGVLVIGREDYPPIVTEPPKTIKNIEKVILNMFF
jgi:hypothetical protein